MVEMVTACAQCIHVDVCEHKGEYLKAVQALNDMFVPVNHNARVKLQDLKFILPVKLVCAHYLTSSTVMRQNEDINESEEP